ncbi:hypothetical protein R6Q59_021180 [Mikania micrantha]
MYYLCKTLEEDLEHLLISCDHANHIWNFFSSSWCKVVPIYAFSIKDLLDIHLSVSLEKKKRKILRTIIVTALWCICCARNKASFVNQVIDITKTYQEIKALSFLQSTVEGR